MDIYSLLLTRLARVHFSPDADLQSPLEITLIERKENLEALRLLNTSWLFL